jgi:hypothetical protein
VPLLEKGLELGRGGIPIAGCQMVLSAMPNKQSRGLTLLTQEEPIPEPALEVLKRGIAHKVAVLTVLQRAVSPAGAVKGVVVHSNDVHDGGNELSSGACHGNLYRAEQRNISKQVNRGSQVTG